MSDGSNEDRVVGAVSVFGDVVVAWLFVGLASYVVLTSPPSLTRFVLALALLFVVPGYLLVAGLFPSDTSRRVPMISPDDRTGLSVRERLALSFGASVALAPLLGFLVGMTTAGITTWAVLTTFGTVVAVFGVAAIGARLAVPPDERFVLPVGSWLDSYSAAYDRRSPAGRAVMVVLSLSVLLALSTAVYALAVPQPAEEFTDFYLATDGGDGEDVTAGYPSNLTEDQSAALVFGVENYESEPQRYEVVVTLERLLTRDGEAVRVEREELGRYDERVGHGERWVQPHQVTPPMAGEDLQLNYYLYRGAAPEAVGPDSAYRHLHTRVDIRPTVPNQTPGGGQSGGGGPGGG
jgi:uncharacterized membrane protein